LKQALSCNTKPALLEAPLQPQNLHTSSTFFFMCLEVGKWGKAENPHFLEITLLAKTTFSPILN
jgi:hypothetical protein